MNLIPSLHILTCLGLATGTVCSRAAAEPPVRYIFELSDEPIRVHPGEMDRNSVFFPEYSRGTTPQALKQQASMFQWKMPELPELPEPQPVTPIRMHPEDDDEAPSDNELSGYEFHHPEAGGHTAFSTEPIDAETWLNDGDPDTIFFRNPDTVTPVAAPGKTATEELPADDDNLPGNLKMTMPEQKPHPLRVTPSSAAPLRTIIKTFNGTVYETPHPMHPASDNLPPGYVPIPALPAYQPSVFRKLK